MNCSDVEKKWENYLSGNLTVAEEAQIEAHINKCNACNTKLNDELRSKSAAFLNNEKETRILKYAKWKSRITNALFVLFLILLITIVSSLLSALYYIWGEPDRAHNAIRVSSMMTEMTMPNIIPGSGGSNIKSFFRMESSYELRKQVGREIQSIGTLETNMLFNLMNVVRNWNGGSLDLKLYFVYPEKQGGLENENTWSNLEILPEGTVSELAVSFDQSYSLDEVYQLFSGYDVELLWFAVNTGVESVLRNTHISTINGLWGFPHFGNSLIYEPDNTGSYTLKVEGDSEKKAAAFIGALEFLIEHEAWAQKSYRGNTKELLLQERLNYVKENGVKVYGAVVTGPTKELLRLKEVEEIRFPVLGEVTWWNWQARDYHGTIWN